MIVPSAYTEGYAKARLYDQAGADHYVRHTTIGDPGLDPVMEELSSLPPAELHQFIEAGIEQRDEGLRRAPQSLRDFFETPDPPWLDLEAFHPGVRVFNANADLMLTAFVTGVLVEGFSTLIAKSFYITGRVAATPRRLRQNNRQLMEIFYPGGVAKRRRRLEALHARALRACPHQGPAGEIRRVAARSVGHAAERGALGVCHLRLFPAAPGIRGVGGRGVQQGRKRERARGVALHRVSDGDS